MVRDVFKRLTLALRVHLEDYVDCLLLLEVTVRKDALQLE
jgi:hypothetical protein